MKYFFLFLLILLSFPSFAQHSNVEYKVSSPYENAKGLNFEYVSNPKLGVTIGYKMYYYGSIIIQAYDTKSMTEIARNKLDKLIRNIVWVGEKLYVFYEYRATSKSPPYIYAREVDYKTCEFKGKEIKLFSSSKMHIDVKALKSEDVLIEQSRDKSKTLIYILQEASSSTSYVTMLAVDQDFEKIGSHKYKMPYSDTKMSNSSFKIDSKGIPYLICKTFGDSKAKDPDVRSNHLINFFKFDLENKEYTKVEIPSKEQYIRGITCYELEDQKFVIAGNSVTDKNSENTNGGYIVYVDKNLKASPFISYKTDEKLIYQYTEFWENFMTNKKIKNIPTELKNLRVCNLVVAEDKSVTLISEQQYTTYTSKYSYLHYDNILVTKLDKDGDVLWTTKIPKKMRGQINIGNSAFIHRLVDDNHYFFVNDHRDNSTLKEDGEIIRQAAEHHGNFCLFKINNETGKLSKHIIFDMMDVNGVKAYNLRTDRVMWCSNNEFILECYKKKKEDIMIKVKIKS